MPHVSNLRLIPREPLSRIDTSIAAERGRARQALLWAKAAGAMLVAYLLILIAFVVGG